jgi:hypothetical protein
VESIPLVFGAGNKLWRHVILRGHHDVFGRQGTFVPAASPFPRAAAALGSWCMFGWLSFFRKKQQWQGPIPDKRIL